MPTSGEANAVVTTLTPAPKTFTNLKTEIARYAKLPDDADALAVAADGIYRAINKLNFQTWNIQRKNNDIATVTNQKEYDLPADWLKPLYCELLSATTFDPIGRLDYLSPSAFDYSYTDRSAASGTPLHWTVFNFAANAKMTLSAYPSSSWTTTNAKMRVRYYASFNYPINASDTVSTIAGVELFVAWDAKEYIADHYSNDTKKQRASDHAQEALQMFQRWDDSLVSGA
jgi:hypothetical protein